LKIAVGQFEQVRKARNAHVSMVRSLTLATKDSSR
jgi:hypothetical protein